jgi:hypothetical protein
MGLSKKLHMRIQIFLIFFLFIGCNEKPDKIITPKKTNDLQWLLTGLPDDHTKENIIAKLYGFQFENIGGCVVSKQLRDSINLINKKTNDSLTRKFGKYWRRDFQDCIEYIDKKIIR